MTETFARTAVVQSLYMRPHQFPARISLLRWLGQQTWIPKGHDALLRALHDPRRSGHFKFDIDFFGQRYRGDLGNYVDWLVFCYGAAPYSEITLLQDLTRYLRTTTRTSLSFFDVGANVGHHTLFMAPLVDNVYAFEPFQKLTAVINDKITLNKLGNVRVFPYALGETDQIVDYFAGEDANLGAGSLLSNFPGVVADAVSVTVRNGDRLLQEANLPRIDLLKIDVQGFEAPVLRGMAKRLLTDRPAILLELSAESRCGFGSEAEFMAVVYPGAVLAEVTGRHGRPYKLAPFDYKSSDEIVILPPEMAEFVADKL